MEEKNEVQAQPVTAEAETPLDKNVRFMSPTQMVVRRFFRSKLSIVGLIMVIALFIFSFLGPLVYGETPKDAAVDGEIYVSGNGKWGETELDSRSSLHCRFQLSGFCI